MRRARQIFESNSATSHKSVKYPTHFNCILNEDEKKTMSPWLLEKVFSQAIGSGPKSIRSISSSTYVVEAKDQKQSEKIAQITNLNNKPVQMVVNDKIAISKGLIYIYNYDMRDFPAFKKEICKDLGAVEVTQATWIKNKNELAQPLLVEFRGELPTYVKIPGEQAMTKVIESIRTPMICKTCQNYNHTANYCNREQICRRCSGEGHLAATCTLDFKCLHCGEPHAVGAKQCREQILQKEILAIQSKENIPRHQALILYKQRFPNNNPGTSYAAAAASTSTGQKPEDTKAEKRKRTPADDNKKDDPPSKRGPIEVVCESPGSGRLFKAKVNINQEQMETVEDETNSDLENYQQELKHTKKGLTKTKSNK